MSVMPHDEPECLTTSEPSVELDIEARKHDLGGGFVVRRLLPSVVRRTVGPFIFFDHMGPVQMASGAGLDVRPHPHINLATVTYLFDGEILHRDSLGSEQVIRPGAVNWMTAGRGIVHSERTPTERRSAGPHVHGLQLWVALPTAFEEVDPSFQHCAEADVPVIELPSARLRLVAGEAYGETSPVRVHSPLFYADAELERGAKLELPDEYADRALYVVTGAIVCDGKTHDTGAMIVFREGVPACIEAPTAARVMLFGGAPLDGKRHIFWNFVSSSKERIEEAKRAWTERRFPSVPGDDQEFIPLPSR